MQYKRFIASYAAIAALAGGGIYYAVSNADAAPKKNPAVTTVNTKPVSLVGDWHQTKGMPGVTMRAEISGDGIQVNLHFDRDNVGGIFWMGSFDTSDQRSQSFTVTSLVDPDGQKVLDSSLFATSEHTKKFTYKDGDLSFEFSMMGVESIVHLSRGAN